MPTSWCTFDSVDKQGHRHGQRIVKNKNPLAVLLAAAFIVIGAHLTTSTNHIAHLIASPIAGSLAAVGWFSIRKFNDLRRMTSMQRAWMLLAMVIMILSSTSYL